MTNPLVFPSLILCGTLLPCLCLAADAPHGISQEQVLVKKLERLKKEEAATQRQLDAIHSPRLDPIAASNSKGVPPPAGGSKPPAEDSKPQSINPFSGVIKSISLRDSVFGENAFQKDASISYTHPGHGASSYAIDAGLKFELQPQFSLLGNQPWAGNTFSSFLGVEYHRNSNTGALKDIFEVGAEFEDVFGYAATSPLLLDITGNIYYKVDGVRRFDSLIGSVKMVPVIRFEKMGLPGLSFLSTDEFRRMWGARWRWQPFVEAQYENTVQAGSGVASGHHVLIDYGAELRIYPFFSSKLGTKVEVTATYKGWTPVDSRGIFSTDRTSSYFETELTYWFEAPNLVAFGETTHDKTSIGVSVGYQNGDNLETGQKKVDLLTLSLHARF